MTSRILSRQTPAPGRRHQQFSALATGGVIVRAEADYKRLRQAWLDLSKGEGNEVALAMVGADMERANRLLQSLLGPRKPPPAHGRDPARERQALHFAEESA